MTTLLQRMHDELVRRNYAATTIRTYLHALRTCERFPSIRDFRESHRIVEITEQPNVVQLSGPASSEDRFIVAVVSAVRQAAQK